MAVRWVVIILSFPGQALTTMITTSEQDPLSKRMHETAPLLHVPAREGTLARSVAALRRFRDHNAGLLLIMASEVRLQASKSTLRLAHYYTR
jgi:hypothetical protein